MAMAMPTYGPIMHDQTTHSAHDTRMTKITKTRCHLYISVLAMPLVIGYYTHAANYLRVSANIHQIWYTAK